MTRIINFWLNCYYCLDCPLHLGSVSQGDPGGNLWLANSLAPPLWQSPGEHLGSVKPAPATLCNHSACTCLTCAACSLAILLSLSMTQCKGFWSEKEAFISALITEYSLCRIFVEISWSIFPLPIYYWEWAACAIRQLDNKMRVISLLD